METITKWEPIAEVPNILYLDYLRYGDGGLIIYLKEDTERERRLKLHFKNFLGFRNFDESYRLKTISEKDAFSIQPPWSLFIAENDELIEWVNDETYEIFKGTRVFKNHIIATPDDIIEVVSDVSPTVQWVN
jgi:hypothetical protein